MSKSESKLSKNIVDFDSLWGKLKPTIMLFFFYLRGKTGAKFHASRVQILLNASLLTGWIARRCSSIHVDLHIQTDYAVGEKEGKRIQQKNSCLWGMLHLT